MRLFYLIHPDKRYAAGPFGSIEEAVLGKSRFHVMYRQLLSIAYENCEVTVL
jgi:hypothetical protein